MIDLILAAVLFQAHAPSRCDAVPAPTTMPAACPQWRSMGRDEGSEMFFDPVPVSRNGDTIMVRTRTVFDRSQEEGTRSIILQIQLDCRARTGAPRHMTMLGANGARLFDMNMRGPDAAPRPVPEVPFGTPGGGLLANFCAPDTATESAQTIDPCNAVESAGAPLTRCPPWRVLGSDGRGAVAIDPTSIQRSGDSAEVRTRLVYDTTQLDRVRSLVMRLHLECTRRTATVRHIMSFRADGSVLGEQELSQDMSAVNPNTVGAEILTIACAS